MARARAFQYQTASDGDDSLSVLGRIHTKATVHEKLTIFARSVPVRGPQVHFQVAGERL